MLGPIFMSEVRGAPSCKIVSTNGQTDRQKQMDKQIDKQTDRQTYIQTSIAHC